MKVHGKTKGPLRFKKRNSNQMNEATRAFLENGQTNVRRCRPFSEVTNLEHGAQMRLEYAATLVPVGRLYVFLAGRQVKSFEVLGSLLT